MNNMNFNDLIQQKKQMLHEINEHVLFYFLKNLSDLASLTRCGLVIYEESYSNSSMYKIGLVNCSEEYFSNDSNKPTPKQFDKNNFVMLNLNSLQLFMSIVRKKGLEDKIDYILPIIGFVNDFNSLRQPDESSVYADFKNFVLSRHGVKKLRAINSGSRVMLLSEENFNYDFKNLFSSDEQFARFEKYSLKLAIPEPSNPGKNLKL